jgi:GTP-binding protein Era
MNTRAGFVAIAGAPNAGKSTLLNRLVGEHLAITSPKAQTTRHRVVGIHTTDAAQVVFLDTPGLLEPRDQLHHAMLHVAHAALRDADVVLHVVDATAALRARAVPNLRVLTPSVLASSTPVLVALNKLDLVRPEDRVTVEQLVGAEQSPHFAMSAISGEGVDALVTQITALLPVSPFLFPADDISSQQVRFFCAEFVREAALEQLQDELPHALACEIEEFREHTTPQYIRAVLYVERESQKRMVIGANGSRIRALGQAARPRIETLIGASVYLDLWVKVLPHWRKNATVVKRLGYGE